MFTFSFAAGYSPLLSHRATVAFASSLNGRVRVCCSAVSLLEFHVLQQGVLISLTQDLHDISVELCYQMAV